MGKKKKDKKSAKPEKSEKKKKGQAAPQAAHSAQSGQKEQKEQKEQEQKELDSADALAMFRALSDENRLAILGLLAERELCTAELLQKVDVVQSTMSHHMKVLCDSGLVNCRRDGKKSCYSISQDGVKRLKAYMDHWSDI